MQSFNGNHQNYRFGDFKIEPETKRLLRGGREIHLARRPFEVLLFLIENRERFVSREELLEKFWDGHDVYDDALRKCVGTIRRALDDSQKPPRLIETRYGGGFRFIGEVTNPSELQISNFKLQNEDRKPKTEDRKIFSLIGRRMILVSIFAVSLLFLATLGFYVYFPKENPPKILPEVVAPERSIAVLPLKNLTGDAANDYFTDGMTESLISELSKIKELKVISRSSVFVFKDKPAQPQEIGRRLGAAALLEGSVQRNGDSIRVVARLVSASNGRVLWTSDSFDRSLKDVFEIQDEIACHIAAELRSRLCGGEAQTSKRYTNNTDAYQAYLKGRFHLNKRTADGIKKAIENFEQAVKLDPNYALAHAELAQAYKLDVWYIPIPASETIPNIKNAAQKAIELDDQLPEAHSAMAEVYSFDWDFRNANAENERAMRLNPGDGALRHGYALGIALLGRFDEAIAEIKRAQELDPLSLVIQTDAGWIYYLARRPNEAIAQYKKALEFDPNFTLARFDLALACS